MTAHKKPDSLLKLVGFVYLKKTGSVLKVVFQTFPIQKPDLCLEV